MRCVVVLLIVGCRTVASVLIFAAATAVVTGSVSAVLRSGVICPTAIAVAAVRRTPVDGFAAVVIVVVLYFRQLKIERKRISKGCNYASRSSEP